MPLYDFDCPKCGNIFEDIAAPDVTGGITCPKCGCGTTSKRMSCPSQIPGSGPNRLPSTLLRGGGAKMEKVPMPPQMPRKTGGCGGCSGGSCGD